MKVQHPMIRHSMHIQKTTCLIHSGLFTVLKGKFERKSNTKVTYYTASVSIRHLVR